MTTVAPEESIVPRELQYKVLVIGEYGVGEYFIQYVIMVLLLLVVL